MNFCCWTSKFTGLIRRKREPIHFTRCARKYLGFLSITQPLFCSDTLKQIPHGAVADTLAVCWEVGLEHYAHMIIETIIVPLATAVRVCEAVELERTASSGTEGVDGVGVPFEEDVHQLF